MNGSDVKWLKEMFEQHNKDQQKYLDAKFDDLSHQLQNLAEDIEDVEAVCTIALDDLAEHHEDDMKKTERKIYFAGATAVVLSLLLWTAFGTDALAIVLKFLGGTPIP